jgi:hypothetical protein
LTIFFSTFGLAINPFGEWIVIALPRSPTHANCWATRPSPDFLISERLCKWCQFRQRRCAWSTKDVSWNCETSVPSGQGSTAEMLYDIDPDVRQSNSWSSVNWCLSAVRRPPVSSGQRPSERFSIPESDINDRLTQSTCETKYVFAVTLPYSAGQDAQVPDRISLTMSALDEKRNLRRWPKIHLWISAFRVWDWFASQIDCLKTRESWLSFSWVIS